MTKPLTPPLRPALRTACRRVIMTRRATLAGMTASLAAPWLIAPIGALAQAGRTYFVDPSGGDDGFDGQSEGRAWRSLQRVNEARLAPGDTVLLRRGGVWPERLACPVSGRPGQPITFDAYGEGPPPLITGVDELVGADWRSEGSNRWSTRISALGFDPQRRSTAVYIDGQKGAVGKDGNDGSISQIREPGDWHMDSRELTIFSRNPPGQAYRSVEGSLRNACILLSNVSYQVYRNIDTTKARRPIVAGDPGDERDPANVTHCLFERVSASWGTRDGFWFGGSNTHSNVVSDCVSSYNGDHGNEEKLGHGFMTQHHAHDNLFVGVEAHNNAEDGYQKGSTDGDDNICRDWYFHDNYEDGIDTKSTTTGTIAGGRAINNREQGINLGREPGQFITVIDNFVMGSRICYDLDYKVKVASARNTFIGERAPAARLTDPADGCTFDADLFVNGGAPDSDPRTLVIKKGRGHVFRNVTIYRDRPGAAVRIHDAATDVAFINCIINAASDPCIQADANLTVRLINCLLYRRDGGTLVRLGDERYDAAGLAALVDGLVFDDPQFVDPDGLDFRLRPGSPAIGRGQAGTTTHDNAGRPYRATPSLGAFEAG